MDFPAASVAGSGSSFAFPVTGAAVIHLSGLGRAHPLRFHFVKRAPFASFLSTVTKV